MTHADLLCHIDGFFLDQPGVLGWGAVPLAPLPGARRLSEWVRQEYNGSLAYMEKNLAYRMEPRNFKPWARSAILFSFRYPLGFVNTDSSDYCISAYALGTDYHFTCGNILRDFETFLKTQADRPDLKFFGFTDSAPVFERELAALSGLGWQGKNCSIINQKHGSAFFLAGCFVDFELSRAQKQKNRCGNCTRCLDACPTHALIAPGVLDARKCISCLTIEHRGPVPESLFNTLGNHIFGCDICQRACPWNRRHIIPPRDSTFMKFNFTGAEWLNILRKGGGFQSRFKGTPLLRAGRKLMLRNMAYAAANKNDKSLRDTLQTILAEETDTGIRQVLEGAVKALSD